MALYVLRQKTINAGSLQPKVSEQERVDRWLILGQSTSLRNFACMCYRQLGILWNDRTAERSIEPLGTL